MSSSSPSFAPGPLRIISGGNIVAGGGGPPHDSSMEARVSVLEGRLDRIETKIDQLDNRMRAVETSLASLDGKLTVLVNNVVGKLPSWWQMPAVILGTITVLGALWGVAQKLHLVAL